MNKKVWIAIAVIIALGLAMVAFYKSKAKATHVEIAQASLRSVEELISASGVIEPANSVELAADVSGEVTAVLCKQGQAVAKGDLLLQIRPDTYKSIVERARSSAEAQRFSIAQAQSQLKQAEARLRKAQIDYKQNNRLFEQQVISSAEYEVFKTNLEVAQKDVGTSLEIINAANANYSGSLANLREAEENLRKTNIYAPVAGSITSLKIKTGERVVGTNQMAGTVLLTIAGTGGMDAIVNINENDILKIKKENKARIYIDAEPDSFFEGSIYEIADVANTKASADAVTEYKVKIRLGSANKPDLTPSMLKSGLTTNVEIVIAAKTSVLAVPVGAVQYEKSTKKAKDSTLVPYVFLYSSALKQAEKRMVTAGISSYEYVEIGGDSVKVGDNIITGPYSFFASKPKRGQKVDTAKAN